MITSFKDRQVDYEKPVKVYRCLVRAGHIFSVKQGGYVVGHTDELTLKNVSFKVNEKGKQRCIREQQRNVHAWVEGIITNFVRCSTEVTYNPYKDCGFYLKNTGEEIKTADYLSINKEGVYVK